MEGLEVLIFLRNGNGNPTDAKSVKQAKLFLEMKLLKRARQKGGHVSLGRVA